MTENDDQNPYISHFKDLLKGNLENLNFIKSNSIQIFLSSTFTGNMKLN